MKHNPTCAFWKQGTCKMGDKCTFPHRDLSSTSPSGERSPRGRANSPGRNNKGDDKKDKKDKKGTAAIAVTTLSAAATKKVSFAKNLKADDQVPGRARQ
mgnify:CR=1 FL=1